MPLHIRQSKDIAISRKAVKPIFEQAFNFQVSTSVENTNTVTFGIFIVNLTVTLT